MSPSKWQLVQAGAWLLALAALVLLWTWTDVEGWTDPETLSEWIEPYRSSWFGLPLAVAVFVVAELFMFPVLILIAVCGVAFGPWLGTLYALTGSVASAIPPYFLGRRLGARRLLAWGGSPARKLSRTLERKGVVAVFLVRKIPAPYSLVNMLCGASGVALGDFLLGTVLGMFTGIVLIVVVGTNLAQLIADPRPGPLVLAIGMLLAAVALALGTQRFLDRRLGRER